VGLRVVGAGLPRTGTSSLKAALSALLGGRCYHMTEVPGHPFRLGAGWEAALAGEPVDWDAIFHGYTAAVDWPASMFWRELAAAYPGAPVLLSLRPSAREWWESMEATILPVARRALAADHGEGGGLFRLLERFTATAAWDDAATLMEAYERHNAAVRQAIPPGRLVTWQPTDGWTPLCRMLGVPEPAEPFPHANKREAWRRAAE
jgi:hypothetical protein